MIDLSISSKRLCLSLFAGKLGILTINSDPARKYLPWGLTEIWVGEWELDLG